MTIVRIPSVGSGVVADAADVELPLGVWSDARNVTFREGYLTRSQGIEQVFTTPSVTPYFLQPYTTVAASFWVHAGLGKVFADDGTTRTDITPASDFTGGVDDRWTGGVLHGVLVLNNGVEKPQYWLGDTGTNLANLPNWDANWRCKSMRPFRNYLFAFDITKSGTRYPHTVKWSAAADPGTYPASWNEADPANDAGEQPLSETAGLLVDGLPMGDALVIYKTDAMYLCRYVGGQQVFSFSRLPGAQGMLARGCVAETPLGHVVLAGDDVVLHSGTGPKSIADARVRQRIFAGMDTTYAARSFVVASPARSEVWVCYPESGQTACTMAAIWNWKVDAWSFVALPSVTYGAVGKAARAVDETWAAASGTWDTDTDSWGGAGDFGQNELRVLFSSASAIAMSGVGSKVLGSSVTAYAERTGIVLEDAQAIKLCKGAWPRIDAAPGTQVTVQVGGSMALGVAPTYKPARTYTVGTSQKVDCLVSGRYLAFKIGSTSDSDWRVRGVDLDVVAAGKF